jgi:hypothetical protein
MTSDRRIILVGGTAAMLLFAVVLKATREPEASSQVAFQGPKTLANNSILAV